MATLDELQQQLQALKAQVDALTAPPDEYYMSKYSGEELDELLGTGGGGTVKTVAGVGPDDDGNVPLTASNVSALPAVEDAENPGCYYRMFGDIKEWINPPIKLGVEYRTANRYNGKPVYTQLVPFGPFPNNTLASTAHGIANFGDCIEFTINTVNGKGGPMNGDLNVVGCWANKTQMNIKTKEDYSSSTANVLLRYTKTTD